MSMKDGMKKGVKKYEAGVKTLRKVGAGAGKALKVAAKSYRTGTMKMASKMKVASRKK